jgi:hypothetical protein
VAPDDKTSVAGRQRKAWPRPSRAADRETVVSGARPLRTGSWSDRDRPPGAAQRAVSWGVTDGPADPDWRKDYRRRVIILVVVFLAYMPVGVLVGTIAGPAVESIVVLGMFVTWIVAVVRVVAFPRWPCCGTPGSVWERVYVLRCPHCGRRGPDLRWRRR